jgi:secernin
VRNISNCLSIRTEFERCSQGLRECAKQRGYWDGRGEFDWAAAFSDGGSPPLGQLSSGREVNGHRLLQAAAGALDPRAMMHILRDSSSGICMCGGGGFRSNGAQVSWLVPPGCDDRQQQQQAQHWFTATPDPQRSIFKPFSFPPGAAAGWPARLQPTHGGRAGAAQPAACTLACLAGSV